VQLGPGQFADHAGVHRDLMNVALYYRLLWRGERMTLADVEPLVDHLLRAASGS
jgi:hypothetical protein